MARGAGRGVRVGRLPTVLTEPADRPAARTRARAGIALRWILVAAVLAGFGWKLAQNWSDFLDALGRLHPLTVAAALGLCLLGTTGSAQAWRAVLADLGSPIPAVPGARIFFVGQLGKYVPGSVWPVVVQMRLGQRFAVPRTRMAVAFLVTLGLSVALGLLVGLAALPALLTGDHARYAWILVLLPIGLVFLHPRPLNGLIGLALRVTRRAPLERPLSGLGIARTSAGTLVFWLVGGLHVWLLAVDLGADPWPALPVALGGFALAFCVGPLLVVLPAGAGVREAILVVVLSGAGVGLDRTSALAVAVVSRVLLMITDGVLAAAAVALDSRTRLPSAG